MVLACDIGGDEFVFLPDVDGQSVVGDHTLEPRGKNAEGLVQTQRLAQFLGEFIQRLYLVPRGGDVFVDGRRVGREQASEVLEALWQREMPTGVYDPRWLPCVTPHGRVRALAFTLSRKSPQHTGRLSDNQMLDILRHARGRYGTTLEYLVCTARCLAERGVRDREIERLLALTRKHGLA